jgi:hypothetical protein
MLLDILGWDNVQLKGSDSFVSTERFVTIIWAVRDMITHLQLISIISKNIIKAHDIGRYQAYARHLHKHASPHKHTNAQYESKYTCTQT